MFDFRDEHLMVRKMMRRWTTEKLEPRLEALESGEPPYELFRDFAKTFGIPGLIDGMFEKMKAKAAQPPEEREKSEEGGGLGGMVMGGGDPAFAAILSIELSRHSPGFMLAFGATAGLAGGAIMSRGTLEQKLEWGRPLLRFDKIGGWGMTEPGAGSDAFGSMRTSARQVEGGYLLNGQKTFITNAPYADTFVIYAKVDDGDGTPVEQRKIEAFIVERGEKGLSTSEPMKKMGMHASPTGEVFLDDCFVSAERLLGGVRQAAGRDSGKGVFHTERTGTSPMCFGIIERCLEVSTAYAKDRQTWGKPIAEYQLVQEKLARMYVHLENVRNMMFKEIYCTRKRIPISPAEASSHKLYCARAATECAMEAVQVLGGNGYMQEYNVERLARDAKLLQIGGGTDEIQIINIARDLLSENA